MGLKIDPDAFESIPAHIAKRLLDKIDWLWEHRETVSHYPLSGHQGHYRLRVGKYRVIYTYAPNPDDLVIRLAALRDVVYKKSL